MRSNEKAAENIRNVEIVDGYGLVTLNLEPLSIGVIADVNNKKLFFTYANIAT